MPTSVSLGAVEDKILKGFGVVRHCCHGYKIGPLFADSLDVAEMLYLSLISTLPTGSVVYLDIPDPNPEALVLTRKFNMREVFATLRMYSEEQPSIDLHKIYGVTTFELG